MKKQLSNPSWMTVLFTLPLYLGLTKLGWFFALAPSGISPVWPPAGLGLAMVILWGRRYAWTVLFWAAICNLFFLDALPAITSALATSAEVWAIGYLIKRFCPLRDLLGSPGYVFRFLLISTCGAFVGAIVGATAFSLTGLSTWPIFIPALSTWWLGDLFGIMILTPVFLAWQEKPTIDSRAHALEGLCVLGLLIVGTKYVFWGWGDEGQAFPIVHATIPTLLWATFRFGQQGATLGLLIVSSMATIATSQSHGPFAFTTVTNSLHLLQLYVAVLFVAALPVAAARKQNLTAQRKLRESEYLYQSVLEGAPLSIFLKNKEGRFTFVNRRFCEVNKLALKDILGKSDFELYDATLAEKYATDDQLVVETREELETVEEFRNSERQFFVHTVKTPVKNADDQVVGILGASWDVTQREETQRALRRAMQMADSANIAKSEFLANMSHEIRTPLAAILGFVERMEIEGRTEKQQKQDLVSIRRSADHLSELIDDILDLSKIEAGKLIVENVRFNILSELGHLFRILRAQAKAKGLFLNLQFEGKIPRFVSTDPKRFRQILINVIGNAIKFTQVGGVSVNVRTIEKISSVSVKQLSVVVTDTGCGIGKKHQSQLFRPFVQGDASTTRKYGGTGLGLTLSRRLAQSLGGNIRLLKSKPGAGSTFEIVLGIGNTATSELVDGFSLDQLEKEPRKLFSIGPDELKDAKVLLAEDGLDNQELVSFFLSSSGAKVDIAPNGEEAIQLANEHPYDVILMDIQMPVLDGYSAIRRLRRTGYKRPIVALTAHAMVEEKKKCFEAGCDGYLTKPVNRATLIRTVKKYSDQQHAS